MQEKAKNIKNISTIVDFLKKNLLKINKKILILFPEL